MGSAEIASNSIIIYSHFVTYGSAADPVITKQICEEIETMWNEPLGILVLKGTRFNVRFHITGICSSEISDIEIYQNTDPRNNYFRIEEYAEGNISFVDGLGCNSGYFLKENLYPGSTTAAHEYGHTLGLPHPENIDLRGKGIPGIMYPRGTLVDPVYQYNPSSQPGTNGGTMHPVHRKVFQKDIDDLRIHRLNFENGKATIGDFTNQWHDKMIPES